MSSSSLFSSAAAMACPAKSNETSKRYSSTRVKIHSSKAVDVIGEEQNLELRSGKEKMKDVVVKQAALVRERMRDKGATADWDVDEAYESCLKFACMEVSTIMLTTSAHPILRSTLSFFVRLAVSILKPRHRKYLAAIAVWYRRTDELADGMNRSSTTLETLDKWEERLFDLFHGQPHDIFDAALADTIHKHHLDIQLFKDFMKGTRSDLVKQRCETFDEVLLYNYYIVGTTILMFVQVMGISAESKASLESVYDSAMSYAIFIGLADQFRDIPEDLKLGRIYIPQDELLGAGLSDEDLFSGKVTPNWRCLMKEQIERARMYADEGEKFISELKPGDRWMFRLISLLNRQILENIEANDYSLTKQTSVGIIDQLKALVKARFM